MATEDRLDGIAGRINLVGFDRLFCGLRPGGRLGLRNHLIVGDGVLDVGVIAFAPSHGIGATRLQDRLALALGIPEHPCAPPEGLHRMRHAGDHLVDDQTGVRPDKGGPALEERDAPFVVVGGMLGKIIGMDDPVASGVAAPVLSHQVTLYGVDEHLGERGADVQHLLDVPARHSIMDVIEDEGKVLVHCDPLPLEVFVSVGRQRQQ